MMLHLPMLVCSIDEVHDTMGMEETISKTLVSYKSLVSKLKQSHEEVESILRLCKAQMALMSMCLSSTTSNRSCHQATAEVSILGKFALTIVLQATNVTELKGA